MKRQTNKQDNRVSATKDMSKYFNFQNGNLSPFPKPNFPDPNFSL